MLRPFQAHAQVVEHEDLAPVTEAQWEEHGDAWRWAHLDLAPSEYHRRRAMEERDVHERLGGGQVTTVVVPDEGFWAGRPHLALEMAAILLVVVAVVIGVAVR